MYGTFIKGNTATVEDKRGKRTLKIGDVCIVSPDKPRACPKQRGRRCVLIAFPSGYGWNTNCKIRYLDTNRIGHKPADWLIPEGWEPKAGVQDA